jgi:hypothetical protein
MSMLSLFLPHLDLDLFGALVLSFGAFLCLSAFAQMLCGLLPRALLASVAPWWGGGSPVGHLLPG